MGRGIKMLSREKSNRPPSSELNGVNGEDDQFTNYCCRPSPDTDYHIPLNCKGDQTSDTSGSSYRSALSSEEAESFKDCVEYLEEDSVPECTYCESEYEGDEITAASILPAAQTGPMDRSRSSKDTVSQLHGTLNSFSSAGQDPCRTNNKGEDHSYAADGAQSHFALKRSEAQTVHKARTQRLQQGGNGAVNDQSCRDRFCASGKASQQVQASIRAKNSSDPAGSGRMGLVTRRLPSGDSSGSKYLDHPTLFSAEKPKEMPLNTRKLKKSNLGSRAHAAVSSKPACPKYRAENSRVLSDSEELDNEVEKLTALSFQSLSCPQGSYLDMYSSGTSSSLSNSLPEDNNGMNRWPPGTDQRKTGVVNHPKGNWHFPPVNKAPEQDLLSNVLRKEPLECIDTIALENADSKKSLPKKRMVPKRQIQLRRKDKKEAGFCPAGECAALQPFTQARKEPCVKDRTISDEFRVNYKQFMKAAYQNNAFNKTRIASNLVKNVLAKKMQYEQRIKMEQRSVQGSSTSSVPSSISTDLPGDSLEGKSSSLSKSDCSFSTEDMQSHSTSERSESVAVDDGAGGTLRPAKGVVLNQELQENVCKIRNTFNELTERMRQQEASQGKKLPILADCGVPRMEPNNRRKQIAGERKEYRWARAVFESMEMDSKRTTALPKFAKPQKPWPNLKQRAIGQTNPARSKGVTTALKPQSLAVHKDTSRNVFTSKTKEMKLIPRLQNEQNGLAALRSMSSNRVSNDRKAPAFKSMTFSSLVFPTSGKSHSDEKLNHPQAPCPEANQMGKQGEVRVHRPRGVRKIVKDTLGLAFKPSNNFCFESKDELPKEPMPSISPLFIRCTSVRRKGDAQAVNSPQEKKQDQTGDIDVSTLSLCDPSTRGRECSSNSNPPIQTYEPAVQITTIQSKKFTVGNKDRQPQVENKPLLCERSELNVIPSSTVAKKESQLNIKVNSSVSKQSHKTETKHFPALSCSTLDEGAMNGALPQFKENHAPASEALVIPSATYFEDATRRDNGRVAMSHFSEHCKPHEAELTHPKHFSEVPNGSQDSARLSKEGDMLLGSISGCIGHPLSTGPLETQTLPNSNFAGSISETKMLEDSKSLGGSNRQLSECIVSDNPLTDKYGEGIRQTSNSSFMPSTSYGKIPENPWDCSNKHQETSGQYFSATPGDNTNYLTLPVATHQSDAAAAAAMPPRPSCVDGTSFTSNVSFQPSGKPPGNNVSHELFPPKHLERKAPTDNLLPPSTSHGQVPVRLQDSPSFTRRNERMSPSGKSASSPTRHFAAPVQAHRKMLVDPDSGKCYYVELPRQPQLKMLYDPETGQYIEVLLPPAPLTAHSGLYQAPFSPVVMSPGGYGPPYGSYAAFPSFPPPPPAVPAVHLEPQDQQSTQENTSVSDGFNSFSKNDASPTTQTADGNYMESLYYIPTGINPNPNPNPGLFSPPTCSGPSMLEKGPFHRM